MNYLGGNLLEWWRSIVGHAWEIHGGALLVDRLLRLKEINRIPMSRSLRVLPQANMGSGLVEYLV